MTATTNIRSGFGDPDAQPWSAAADPAGPGPAACTPAPATEAPGRDHPDLRSGHHRADARTRCAAADPNDPSPARSDALPVWPPLAAGSDLPDGQDVRDAQCCPAVGEAASLIRDGHASADTPVHRAVADQTRPATEGPAPPVLVPSLADPFLYLAAQAVDDLEKLRKASANRLRILTTPADQPDEDGVCRGFGLDQRHPAVAAQAALVAGVAALEHQAVLELQRRMRKHPLGPWGKTQRGVGEKQLARLLAVVGDPYWNTAKDQPRTVSQLWAYCGYRPGQKRRKGERANWSTDAKTRAYLIAESCMKAGGPYRAVYDQRRAHTALTHPEWTDGHSHTDGLRVAAKAVLRDLWREAARLHGADPEAT